VSQASVPVASPFVLAVLGSQGTAVRGKEEPLNIEKRGGLATLTTVEGLKDMSPCPFRGLPLANRNMVVSFVLMYCSVKEPS